MCLLLNNNDLNALLARTNLVMEAIIANFFSCWDDRHIWISWNSDGSHVEVGHGSFPMRNAFLRLDEGRPFGIKAFSFRTESTGNADYDDNYFSRFTIARNSS